MTYDVEHDWSKGLHHYPLIGDDKRFTHTLEQTRQEEYSTTGPNVSFTCVFNHTLFISGGVGTGKSTLINAIVRSTMELFGNDKVVRIMTPTGVAAFNIGVATIHHELSTMADKSQSYKNLEMEQFDYFDEYSMIGRTMLANIDLRCRNIFASS
ncbi:hypothetical protein MKX01_025803 [Papaver californicum]|nr:hypothetical protein MKX01_025803 [Papaver californicum]